MPVFLLLWVFFYFLFSHKHFLEMGSGGAISSDGKVLTVTNTTFTGNRAWAWVSSHLSPTPLCKKKPDCLDKHF
jgi:hypothetical protein